MRECGASVYSASDSAAKEFGENVPLSARGAAARAAVIGSARRFSASIHCTCRVDGVYPPRREQTAP